MGQYLDMCLKFLEHFFFATRSAEDTLALGKAAAVGHGGR
jgi:hypothetical protein